MNRGPNPSDLNYQSLSLDQPRRTRKVPLKMHLPETKPLDHNNILRAKVRCWSTCIRWDQSHSDHFLLPRTNKETEVPGDGLAGSYSLGWTVL